MNTAARDILTSLYKEQGIQIASDHRALEDLLKFKATSYKLESNLLVAAVKLRVPKTLFRSSKTEDMNTLVPRLAKRFEKEYAITPSAGHWAVISWCEALGIKVPPELIEPPDMIEPHAKISTHPAASTPVAPVISIIEQENVEAVATSSGKATQVDNSAEKPSQNGAISELLARSKEDDKTEKSNDASRKIVVKDPILDEIIRALMRNPYGELDCPDLLEVKSLDISNEGITRLEGIEVLENLETLVAKNNRIVDISPLASLKKLTGLNLNSNNIVDISPIAEMTSLKILSMKKNEFLDIIPILHNSNSGGFKKGDSVVISGNPLSPDALNIHAPILLARGVAIIYKGY